MKMILSENDKKILRWVSKYINSFGRKTGLISLYIDDQYDIPELSDYIEQINHFEPHHDVPKQLIPIIEKAFEISQKKLDSVSIYEEDINYATIDITIDTETKEFLISYFYSFYAPGDTDTNEWSNEECQDQISLLTETAKESDFSETFLTLRYNGSGDSGYIESYFEEGLGVPEPIEDWCYGKLSYHSGWEINEGSQGYFEFDLKNKTINLFHTMNFEESTKITLFEEKFG